MYWKISFSKDRHCVYCCQNLIRRNVKIIKKNVFSIIIQTDMTYNDILNICLEDYVDHIKPCNIRNWLKRNFKNGQLRNTSKD